MAGHMKQLLKQVSDSISGTAAPVRPRMQGSLLPPKVPKLTPKQRPQKKESGYKFL